MLLPTIEFHVVFLIHAVFQFCLFVFSVLFLFSVGKTAERRKKIINIFNIEFLIFLVLLFEIFSAADET